MLQPTLNRLATQTLESFSAVVRDGDEVVIVARSSNEWRQAPSDPVRMLAYGLHLGARLPVHATSTGRVLLAALTKTAFNQWMKASVLSRLTSHTTTDSRRLRVLVEQARVDDFCFASEEHELGVHALAVPLRNVKGQTVAALNMVTSSPRLARDAMRRDLLLLLDAAKELRPFL